MTSCELDPGYGVVKTWNPGYSALTKITEFHDFGTKFELDRIFSFFFHIEGGCQAPTSPKPSFWPLSQKWPFCPKLSYLIYGEFYPFLSP